MDCLERKSPLKVRQILIKAINVIMGSVSNTSYSTNIQRTSSSGEMDGRRRIKHEIDLDLIDGVPD
ncbi:MAG: hypothetical protein JWR54_2613 [Mucilaginibacter sp.]|nr:hypothetical protein [Mucilaginibacter sp.]